MRNGVRLGRIAGIDVIMDWSLLIIFFLITFSLGAGLFPSWHPQWGPGLIWGTAAAAAVLFLASVFVHELSHAVVGRAQGMEINPCQVPDDSIVRRSYPLFQAHPSSDPHPGPDSNEMIFSLNSRVRFSGLTPKRSWVIKGQARTSLSGGSASQAYHGLQTADGVQRRWSAQDATLGSGQTAGLGGTAHRAHLADLLT